MSARTLCFYGLSGEFAHLHTGFHGLEDGPFFNYRSTYEVGHQARVAEIESALASWPGIILAGAPYHGVGIASCIQDSELVASLLRTHLACQITGSPS